MQGTAISGGAAEHANSLICRHHVLSLCLANACSSLGALFRLGEQLEDHAHLFFLLLPIWWAQEAHCCHIRSSDPDYEHFKASDSLAMLQSNQRCLYNVGSDVYSRWMNRGMSLTEK